jgi:hypothetical protein
MWEKINKVIIQNAVAFMVICGCLFIAIVALFYKIPVDNVRFIDKFYDMCLVGVIGWLFTTNKKPQP